MKSIRKNRVALAVLAALLLALSGTAAVAYANGGCATIVGSAREAATEQHFHLYTKMLALDANGQVIPEFTDPEGKPPPNSITGNLMTFTHPGTPNSAAIGDWQFENTVGPNGRGWISGSFSIDVGWPADSTGFMYGPVYGKIYISFHATSTFVPKLDDSCECEGDIDHYNFQGTFRITGSGSSDNAECPGCDFYDAIKGSGMIGGTFHDHEGPEPAQQWFDFAMIGRAHFPQHP